MGITNSNFKKFIITFLVIILFSSLTPISAETFSFNSSQNISNSAASSINPQITASDTNVYSVWQDGTDIFFTNSTNNGASFNSSLDVGNTGSSPAGHGPQLSVSGNNIYVIWRDGDDIKLINSTNNGVDFSSAEVQLSSSTNSLTSETPQVASTGSNVYAVWYESSDILFRSSTDSGETFVPDPATLGAVDLGNNGGSADADPQITASGTNVYVVWQDGADIRFINSTDSGSTFPFAAADIGDSTGSSTDSSPQITASGTNVYVVWQEGSQIMLSRSSTSGATFETPVTVGTTSGQTSSLPQVVASGSNVYVTWREGTSSTSEIKFRVGTVSGSLSFDTEINLSNSPGSSQNPQIAASGSNVRVAWLDTRFGDPDILFRASNDNGATFGNTENLSNTSGTSQTPQIAIVGDNSYVIWRDPTSGNNEILFISGTPSPISVSFNQTNYRLSETATITANDAGSSGTVSVDVTSDSDSTGITNLTLTETGSGTGIFTGEITFTTGSTSGTSLQVATGDNITVDFGAQNAIASIFNRSITFNDSVIDRGDIVNIEVNDQNANTDTNSAETVNVLITTDANPSGITLTLTETGFDTGLFGGGSGSSKSQLILTTGTGLISTLQTVTISQEELGSNSTSGVDTTSTSITSDSDGTGIILTLTETTGTSAIFAGTFSLNTTSSVAGSSIHAVSGDIITVLAGNGLNRHLIVTPNSNLAVGSIQVIDPIDEFTVTDTLVAAYEELVISQFILQAAGESGGGGGGLVSPGLVVNALAGIGGGGSGGSAPLTSLNQLISSTAVDLPEEVKQMIANHDSSIPIIPMDPNSFEDFDFPLVINDQGFVLGGFTSTLQTQTLKTDTPVIMKFTIYEAEKIQHFSLYMNLRDTNDSIRTSDTQILYNDGKELKIIDPNGFFSDAKITVIEGEEDFKKYVIVEMTFAKEMETSHIITRIWDPNLFSRDTHILDAIKIIPEEPEFVPIPQETEEVQVEELTSQEIPKWVKSNAEWWVDNQIDDESFVAGIQYMVNNGIMYIPNTETVNSVTEIPDWIKTNAQWWVDNQISDDEFVKAMEWLVTNGVITIE